MIIVFVFGIEVSSTVASGGRGIRRGQADVANAVVRAARPVLVRVPSHAGAAAAVAMVAVMGTSAVADAKTVLPLPNMTPMNLLKNYLTFIIEASSVLCCKRLKLLWGSKKEDVKQRDCDVIILSFYDERRIFQCQCMHFLCIEFMVCRNHELLFC